MQENPERKEESGRQSSPIINHHRRRVSSGSDSSAPTDAESSEAETVILDEEEDPERRTERSKKTGRRIQSSSSSSEDEDENGQRKGPQHEKKNVFVRRKSRNSSESSSSASSKKHHSRPHSSQGGVKAEPNTSRSTSPNSNNHTVVQAVRRDGRPVRDASGRLLLQKLCDRGDYDKAKELLEMGVDVNDRDYAGNTAIHDAALKGHTKIVELLLDHNAIIDIRSGIGDLDTPLIDAASRGRINVVKLLLDRGADPRIFNAQGKTALDSLPSESEHYDELEKLLKEAAYSFRMRAKQSNESGDLDHAQNYDPSKSIPGTFPPEAERAKSKGYDRSEDGTSNGKDQTQSYSGGSSRRRGARSQSIRNDLLWMDLTTRAGREQVYRKAADGDIQFVGRSLEEGWQPDGESMVLAAKHGHTDLVGLLLAFGAESDAPNEDGETALEQTIGRGHLDTVKLLLDSGANPLRRDKHGRSYLEIAKEALGTEDDGEVTLLKEAMKKARNDPKPDKHSPPSSSENTSRIKTENTSDSDKRSGSSDHKQKKRKLVKVSTKEDGEKRPRLDEEEEKERERRRAEKRQQKEQDEEHKQEKEKKLAEERWIHQERRRQQEKEAEEKRKREREERRKQEEERKREEEERQRREDERRKQEEEQRKEELREKQLKEEERRKKVARQREAFEAQKEKERKEREKQMLKSLEEEEKRKEEKRRRAEEQRLEKLKQEEQERARKKQLEQEQEAERQKAMYQKRQAESRKNYPYGIRHAVYNGVDLEQMQRVLPLLIRESLSMKYLLDVQLSLFLGAANLYHMYPELTKKLVTDEEKTRLWSMVTPFMCRPIPPFGTDSSADYDKIINERNEDRRRFMAMTFFWLKVSCSICSKDLT
ncbi:hypothetical protein TRICI_005907 [Trichomonascus ciferrii]|uniref:KRIT1 ARM-repeats domain-containing protein n=1 Tax=Trichomonascus ciferrii TaxID=44093 RepID=A0A642UNL1_9ASCO|nr:hypothetical protein TRICI_005907 [Trichomonascus ciferrii]